MTLSGKPTEHRRSCRFSAITKFLLLSIPKGRSEGSRLRNGTLRHFLKRKPINVSSSRIWKRLSLPRFPKANAIGTIAGSYVTSGLIKAGCQVRLLRNGIVTYEGKLGSLKRFKDDAKEVKEGFECGMTIENFNDIKELDVIEAYEMVEKE